MGLDMLILSLGLGSNSGLINNPMSSEKQRIYPGPTTRTKGNLAESLIIYLAMDLFS